MIMSRKQKVLRFFGGYLCLLISTVLGAQDPVIFINSSDILPSSNNSRVALAIADVNGDFRDDINPYRYRRKPLD